MHPETFSARRALALASILFALASIAILLPASRAHAAHDDCRVTVRGPFFYAGLVFPVGEIECDTVKQSIHIDVTLDMDGTEAASAGRTCRKVSSCILGLASDGVFASDLPGDQLWCGSATGSINNRGSGHGLATATSCESESF